MGLLDELKDIDRNIMDETDEKLPSELLIFPSHYRITSYSNIRSTKFEEWLSVWDKIYFKYTYGSYIYDDEKDELLLPGGVDENEIIQQLDGIVNIVDHRDEFKQIERYNRPIRVVFRPRDEIQRKAIEFLMESKYRSDDTQKMLSLNTGDGKTFCAVKSISMSKRVPMIFVDKKNLMEQWIERIMEYTDIDKNEIYIISGKKSIEKLLKMDEDQIEYYKFFIAIHRTISNYFKEDYDNLRELFDHLNISLKVFDEAHLNYENIATIDMITTPPSIYLTATPSRSNYLENRVYQIITRKIHKFNSRNRRIRNKASNYHRVVIAEYDSDPSVEFMAKFTEKSSRRGFDVKTYTNYIVNDKFDTFYEKLSLLLTKLIYPTDRDGDLLTLPKRTIVLVKQIDFVDKIYERLLADGRIPKDYIDIGRFHSKVGNDEKERTMELSDLIITTDSSMGTGMDISNLEAIISTIPTSSPVLTEQMLGRLRELEDEEVFYYDLVDVGFEECRKQLSRRKNNIYMKKAKKIQEVEL